MSIAATRTDPGAPRAGQAFLLFSKE